MHNPVAIANHFINLNNQGGFTLMQLLKLSYIAHGFKLGLMGVDNPLSNELAQAWPYGPVFPKIYNEFKTRPPGKINDVALYFNEDNNSFMPVSSDFTSEENEIMNLVYEIYGNIDGWKLSALTHKEGTPWHDVWKKNVKKIHGMPIYNKDIESHFKNKVIGNYIVDNER